MTDAITEPGRYLNLAAEVYHRSDALSASGIVKLLRTPAHFIADRQAPRAPTEAMQFGTAVHTAVLEPALFDERIFQVPAEMPTRRSNAGREAWEALYAQAGSRIMLASDEVLRIRAVAEAINRTTASEIFLAGGYAETSLFWTDDGLRCRARPDYTADSFDVLVDLKTAEDASREAFMRAMWNYRYDIQAEWYLDGMEKTVGVRPSSYLWCVAETRPPYGVAWYRANQRVLDLARADIARAVRTFRACSAIGEWPCYSDDVQEIDLPPWAKSRDQIERIAA